MSKRQPGRPRSTMTPETIEAILRAVRLGVWPDRAAAMQGISASTMRNMRKRDPEFATAMKRAEAEAESAVLSRILRAMDRQWTAAAWILERRWSERWAKREHVEVSTKGEAKQLLADLAAMRAMSEATPDAAQ